MADFTARMDQSVVDKLLDSTGFPLVVVEKKEPFPGCSNMVIAEQGTFYRYSDAETDKLLADSVATIRTQSADPQDIHNQVYAFAGSIIQQARLVLDASQHPDYEGPPPAELKTLVDDGIANLGPNLRAMLGDFGLYAWCPLIKVTLKQRPQLALRSPRIDLKNVNVEVRATGELYAKYPWWNCYKWCFKWEKVSKCDRIAHLAVSPDLAIDAHVDLIANGQIVEAAAEVDRLRLDYLILRDIPLEKLVNPEIRKRRVKVYDASKLVATVPILESKFRVESISLPQQAANGLQIDVTVVQI